MKRIDYKQVDIILSLLTEHVHWPVAPVAQRYLVTL